MPETRTIRYVRADLVPPLAYHGTCRSCRLDSHFDCEVSEDRECACHPEHEPRILNLRRDLKKGADLPDDVVRIDRLSKWGNPYKIGERLDVQAPEGGGIFTSSAVRHQVITAYRWYLEARLKVEPRFLDPLRGRRLACWCAPEECHGNVILDALEGEL